MRSKPFKPATREGYDRVLRKYLADWRDLPLQKITYRAAAERAGVGYREVYRNAASVGELRDAHKVMWLELWGDDFPPLWQHHLEDPQEEQTAG